MCGCRHAKSLQRVEVLLAGICVRYLFIGPYQSSREIDRRAADLMKLYSLAIWNVQAVSIFLFFSYAMCLYRRQQHTYKLLKSFNMQTMAIEIDQSSFCICHL